MAWAMGYDAGVQGMDSAANPYTRESNDAVNHPSHYTSGPKCECGRVIECITITRERNFDIGNAIKYLWRAGKKSDSAATARDKEIEDLRKAEFYIRDEIQRLENLKEGSQ